MRSAELPDAADAPATRLGVGDHDVQMLEPGWEAACCPAGETAAVEELDELHWHPARVPGTAAAVWREAGRWRAGDTHDFDTCEWWFRTRLTAAPAAPGEQLVLRLDGIATIADVFLDGELVLESDSMFARHAVDVGDRVGGDHELAIRCRPLATLLQCRRKPRARWRTRVVADGNLRFLRTTLLGRAPGFAPGPAPVGPWRPVWLERRRRVAIERLTLRPWLEGEWCADAPPADQDGVLALDGSVRELGATVIMRAELELSGPHGCARSALALGERTDGSRRISGELRIPAVARWWPHTHGVPVLHDARVRLATSDGEIVIDAGRIGFRALSAGAAAGHDVEREGIDLHVNGVRVFARGVLWTPVDPVGLAPDRETLRRALERLREAGMNMVRIPGIGMYESAAFHDLCDELGLLVWQDFMFANLDYPISDADFRASVEREADDVLAEVGGRPSLVVMCGNSEIEQQVGMLGLDPELGRGELFGALLPAAVARAGCDAIWVPSSPCGGTLPFRPNRGIANYYGVGGYRRPLEDVRRAEVRFAGECLAFANVPDDAGVAAVLPGATVQIVVHHPRWKAGVPRDAGSGWDFEDVRDHYLRTLFGVDPGELRRVDHERYLALSRAVTGETMAEVFGEWRRAASPCGGGLVLWARDLVPGAGWGIVDHAGTPKEAYHHLRRALAPVAVWTIDEGLGGIAVHVANDRPAPLAARLRVTLLRDLEHVVGEGEEAVELPPHGGLVRDAEALLGHFADVSWAYRFGPPTVDAVVVTLDDQASALRAQTVRFPAGRPLTREPATRLGFAAQVEQSGEGRWRLTLRSRRLAYGVRVHAVGFDTDDDAFCVVPGSDRIVELVAHGGHADPAAVTLTALNLDGRVRPARERS